MVTKSQNCPLILYKNRQNYHISKNKIKQKN